MNWITEREQKLREFFELAPETELILKKQQNHFDISENIPNISKDLISNGILFLQKKQFRLKKKIIETVFILYSNVKPMPTNYKDTSSYRAVIEGHRRHQGRIIGIETTIKPKYLPENKQLYGTPYGFEPRVDPFLVYMERAWLYNGKSLRT